MPVLFLRFTLTGAGRLGLIDMNRSKTIWTQVKGINSLNEVDLLGFREPMTI
jgi:hypothetical protein